MARQTLPCCEARDAELVCHEAALVTRTSSALLAQLVGLGVSEGGTCKRDICAGATLSPWRRMGYVEVQGSVSSMREWPWSSQPQKIADQEVE